MERWNSAFLQHCRGETSSNYAIWSYFLCLCLERYASLTEIWLYFDNINYLVNFYSSCIVEKGVRLAQDITLTLQQDSDSFKERKSFHQMPEDSVFVKALFLLCYSGIAASKVRPCATNWSREAEMNLSLISLWLPLSLWFHFNCLVLWLLKYNDLLFCAEYQIS